MTPVAVLVSVTALPASLLLVLTAHASSKRRLAGRAATLTRDSHRHDNHPEEAGGEGWSRSTAAARDAG